MKTTTNTPFTTLKLTVLSLAESLRNAASSNYTTSDDINFTDVDKAFAQFTASEPTFDPELITELKDEIEHCKQEFERIWVGIQDVDSASDDYSCADEDSDEAEQAEMMISDRQQELEDAQYEAINSTHSLERIIATIENSPTETEA